MGESCEGVRVGVYNILYASFYAHASPGTHNHSHTHSHTHAHTHNVELGVGEGAAIDEGLSND